MFVLKFSKHAKVHKAADRSLSVHIAHIARTYGGHASLAHMQYAENELVGKTEQEANHDN